MSGKPSIDSELERLLDGEETATSALYRKLPAAAPDASLDAAVLGMARRAVQATAQAAPSPARPRARLSPAWLALGTAAGLVLAAGVAWQMRATIEQNSRESALRGAVAPRGEDRITVQAREAPQRKADSASAPAAPAAVSDAPPQAAPSPPPPPPGIADSRKASSGLAARKDETPPAQDAAPDTRTRREQPGVTEYTLPGGAAGPAPRPFPAAPAAAAPAVANTATRPAAAAPASEPARAAEATGEAVERKARLASGVTPAATSKETAAAPSRNAPPAAATPAPRDAAPSRSVLLQNNARLAPETWIGVMRDLLRDGRRAEARENLDLFRRKHPAYRLPDDLAALAREP